MNAADVTSLDVAAPIGVFDSGVGGLSVMRHLCARLPGERFIYVADSHFAPYGDKSPELIVERSSLIATHLMKQGAKMLVVACNTATAAAVQHLRDNLPLPVVGMEPAVKPASQITRNGVIGVLATTGTLESARFAALLDRYGEGVRVITRSCTGWVELVEQGVLETEHALALVRFHVRPLLDEGVDTLILGCTHYPFLQDLIRQCAGPDVALIETGAAVARRVQQLLDERRLDFHHTCPVHRFLTTGTRTTMQPVFNHLWGAAVELECLPPDLLEAAA